MCAGYIPICVSIQSDFRKTGRISIAGEERKGQARPKPKGLLSRAGERAHAVWRRGEARRPSPRAHLCTACCGPAQSDSGLDFIKPHASRSQKNWGRNVIAEYSAWPLEQEALSLVKGKRCARKGALCGCNGKESTVCGQCVRAVRAGSMRAVCAVVAALCCSYPSLLCVPVFPCARVLSVICLALNAFVSVCASTCTCSGLDM
jgi:hypothetical protein